MITIDMNSIIIIAIIMIMPKVLSYMEDHLKNKQRLEQEWVGLCAYEAEPNSTAIAFKVVSLSMLMLMLMLILLVSAPMRQSSYCVQSDALVVVDVDVDVVVVVVVVVSSSPCLVTGGEQEEEPLPGQAALRSQPGPRQRLDNHHHHHHHQHYIIIIILISNNVISY